MVIFLLGDSLSNGPLTPGGQLLERLKGDDLEKAVNAKDGRHWRDSNFNEIVKKGYQKIKPDFVIFWLGTNDLSPISGRKPHMEIWRDRLERDRVRYLALGPPSLVGQEKLSKQIPALITDLQAVFGANNVLDIRPLTEDLDDGRRDDGIHFKNSGASRLGQRLADEIGPRLGLPKRRRGERKGGLEISPGVLLGIAVAAPFAVDAIRWFMKKKR